MNLYGDLHRKGETDMIRFAYVFLLLPLFRICFAIFGRSLGLHHTDGWWWPWIKSILCRICSLLTTTCGILLILISRGIISQPGNDIIILLYIAGVIGFLVNVVLFRSLYSLCASGG